MERSTVVPLQALRAFAATAVMSAHFAALYRQLNGDNSSGAEFLGSGVDLFFIISGFIMVYSSEQMFQQPGAARVFLIRRAARVIPLYWMSTGAIMLLTDQSFTNEYLLKSLFFIPFRAQNGEFLPINGAGWTLNFEMFFYVLFACCLWCRREFAVVGVTITLLLIVAGGIRFSNPPVLLQFWSDPIVLEFSLGMLVAVAYRHGKRLSPSQCLAILIPAAASLWAFAPRSLPPTDWRFLAWGVPAAVIVCAAVLCDRALPSRLLKPMEVMGNASYSIYLLHVLMVDIIFLTWPLGLNRLPSGTAVVGGAIVTVILAIGVYYAFELPINQAARRLSLPTRRTAAAATVGNSPRHRLPKWPRGGTQTALRPSLPRPPDVRLN